MRRGKKTRLESCELLVYNVRRILTIYWKVRVASDDVLRRAINN